MSSDGTAAPRAERGPAVPAGPVAPRQIAHYSHTAADGVTVLRRVSASEIEGEFFADLPEAFARVVAEHSVARVFTKGELLRSSTAGVQTDVHFIVRGCVAERSVVGDTLRFRGKNWIVGDMDLTDEEPRIMTAECLTATWTRSIPLARMRYLVENDAAVARALASELQRRMTETEAIYSSFRRSVTERVAGLLLDLAVQQAPPQRLRDTWEAPTANVDGPTQGELADALMVSRASVENALAELRRNKVLSTSHRRYVIHDLHLLYGATGWSRPPSR